MGTELALIGALVSVAREAPAAAEVASATAADADAAAAADAAAVGLAEEALGFALQAAERVTGGPARHGPRPFRPQQLQPFAQHTIATQRRKQGAAPLRTRWGCR